MAGRQYGWHRTATLAGVCLTIARRRAARGTQVSPFVRRALARELPVKELAR